MAINNFTPFVILSSFVKTFYFFLLWRIHFPKEYVGKKVVMYDGQKFTIFRHVTLNSGSSYLKKSMAVFRVRFKFAKLSHKANKLASLIPIPLIIGFPGFKDKVWMINEDTGFWQGVYQWESEDAVERYIKSFVLGVMNKRSVPNSISYEIIPNTNLSEYMKQHLYKNTTSAR